jgi:hypothetical protein
MRPIAAFVTFAVTSFCALVPNLPPDPPRPKLIVRAQKDASYELVVRVVGSVKHAVGSPLDVDLETCDDGHESYELIVPADNGNIDSLAQSVLGKLAGLGVRRILVADDVEKNRREYLLLTSLTDAERLLAAETPFVLWFHADWVGEGVLFTKRVFRSQALFTLIGRLHIPIVMIDHTHPTDATNLELSRYSKNRVVPTVVVFRAGQRQVPVVLEGLVSVQPLIEAVNSIDQQATEKLR